MKAFIYFNNKDKGLDYNGEMTDNAKNDFYEANIDYESKYCNH